MSSFKAIIKKVVKFVNVSNINFYYVINNM